LKIINLFGSPGSGKSTTAAGLFHKLKTLEYNVELVTEVAKGLVWSKRFKCLENQAKVTIDQYERMRRLYGEVDYLITDSPLLLGIYYQPKDYFEFFEPFIFELFDSFENTNLFIKRSKKYNPRGRTQTSEESDAISLEIENMLIKRNYKYERLNGDVKVVDNIIEFLQRIEIL